MHLLVSVILIFGTIPAIVIYIARSRHLERMKLIERGEYNTFGNLDVQSPPLPGRFALFFALIFIGLGIAGLDDCHRLSMTILFNPSLGCSSSLIILRALGPYPLLIKRVPNMSDMRIHSFIFSKDTVPILTARSRSSSPLPVPRPFLLRSNFC